MLSPTNAGSFTFAMTEALIRRAKVKSSAGLDFIALILTGLIIGQLHRQLPMSDYYSLPSESLYNTVS